MGHDVKHGVVALTNTTKHAVCDALRDEKRLSFHDTPAVTRFLRNRPQFQTALPLINGPKVAVVGCSRGAEAYSLAIEATLLGIKIDIYASDIKRENIDIAHSNTFNKADIIDFDDASVLTQDVERFFLCADDNVHVRLDELITKPVFSVANLFDMVEDCHLIVCNNVLIHFAPDTAKDALHHLTNRLQPGGILALTGIPAGILENEAPALGLQPMTQNAGKIWNSWKGGRLAWLRNPQKYTAMPPFDDTHPGWEYKFVTLFRKK